VTNPFFNESDFQTIHVEVSMINNNTGMMLKDGKQIFKDRTKNFRLEKVKRTKYVREKSDNSRVDLCEFLENGILIETPKMSCAKGHVLAILIETFRAVMTFRCSSPERIRIPKLFFCPTPLPLSSWRPLGGRVPRSRDSMRALSR
jgi:hypothetical protein